MNDFSELKEAAKDCTILCVEDDMTVQEFLRSMLTGLFKKVLFAENGAQGLSVFKKKKIDILLTDNIMPEMSGIEMIKEIRKTNSKLPIIVMTAYADMNVLMEAINVGVTQFIVKPVRVENLLNAIETAIQRVIVENQRVIQKETELLRFKEKYNSMQQKLALKKQQHIIKDDFYYKKLSIANNKGKKEDWLINIRYQPNDIVSGDFYTIRRLANDKILLYIADAMGKGISAFITTAIVTSFLNYSIDKALANNDFNMYRFLIDFVDFSKKYLSEDEALCAVFVFIDFHAETAHIANFSMPPVFIESAGGEISKIPNNNLPIMRFTEGGEIDRYNISGMKKMLICSDGLYHTAYHEHIEDDFRASPFKGIFFNKFIETVKSQEDDTTFIFLKRLDFKPDWTKTFVIQSRLDEAHRLTAEIEEFLTVSGVDAESIVEFTSAFSEAVMNAYEHGSLNITYRQKNRLVKEDKYEERLLDIEKNIDKKITAILQAFNENGRSFLCATISDEGNGFDTSIIKETVRDIELLHYRGIKIIKGLVDEIHYDDRGSTVMLLKEYSRV
jgi:CheY-like chemotaxis protein/anti-sigma regulatory factor (Ser/Thr protein kinase)